MSQKRREKIHTSGVSTPLFSDALSALSKIDVSCLPPGQEAVPIQSVQKEDLPATRRGRLVLRREKKDRGGKTVVVISGFDQLKNWTDDDASDLLRELRKTLGCGGAMEGSEMVIQGDQPARVAKILSKIGFRVEGVVE